MKTKKRESVTECIKKINICPILLSVERNHEPNVLTIFLIQEASTYVFLDLPPNYRYSLPFRLEP